VLEAFEQGEKRSERVVALCRAVVALAIEQRIDVAIYTGGQIKACFGSVGARTRQEVAEAVARSFEALRPRLPKPRKAWDAPDRRRAIFDAAAAVLAHYQLGASRFLLELLERPD
jgi:Holliday junction resolvasome RuvABC endonuclease subunit